MTDNLSLNVLVPFKTLDIKECTSLIQRGDLTELVSLNCLGRAPSTAQAVQHDPDVTSMEVAIKKHTGQTWVLMHLSDQRILRNCQKELKILW